MKKVLVFAGLIMGILLAQCSIGNKGIVIPSEPYLELSDYNFFEGNLADLKPVEGVLPYELITPLFSDYAHKSRFVWMPEGTSATYDTDHVLDFPKGAVLIKNFYYNHDERDLSKGRRIMETRLLINRGEEWDAYGYIWNDSQTEASYELVGDIKDVSWINEAGETKEVPYIIPNKNQCKSCHAYKTKQMPIGPKARNLNKDFAFADGTINQLEKWKQVGYLKGLNSTLDAPSIADWTNGELYNIHDRSMAYLDVNCGHCHNPDGAANTSGLTLLAHSDTDLKLGIYKPTVSAGAGTGGFTYSIVPGNPDESIMIYRMNSDNPGAMMPEVGRRLVHNEGVDLISDWIAAMDPNEFEAPIDDSAN